MHLDRQRVPGSILVAIAWTVVFIGGRWLLNGRFDLQTTVIIGLTGLIIFYLAWPGLMKSMDRSR